MEAPMRIRWVFVWVILLLLASISLQLWMSARRVTPKAFALIKDGMDETEIEGILGEGSKCFNTALPNKGGIPKQYAGEGYSIIIWYDDTNTIVAIQDVKWV